MVCVDMMLIVLLIDVVDSVILGEVIGDGVLCVDLMLVVVSLMVVVLLLGAVDSVIL